MRAYVCMIGRWAGMSLAPGLAIRMPNAGMARAMSAAAARTAERAGRHSTPRRTKSQPRPELARRNRLPSKGMRPRSTRSPSSASRAGNTVTEPMTATNTTRMVASATAEKVASPARNIPAMATTTVRPETSTDLPDVAAATANASFGERPARRYRQRAASVRSNGRPRRGGWWRPLATAA